MTSVDSLPGFDADRATGIRVRTVSGLKWTYAGVAASVVLQLVYTSVVSRTVDPAAFGLLAMAALALRFGSYFSQLGLGSAIVQRKQLSADDVRASFSLSILTGAAACAAVIIAAPVAHSYFQTEAVVSVIRVLGVCLFIDALSSTALGLLRRQMRFRALALAEVGSFAVGYTVVGVTLAIVGAGVWSLVAASVTQSVVQLTIAYGATRHPIRLSAQSQPMRNLVTFGGRVSVIGFLEFLSGNLDQFSVARFVGAAALGQYSRAAMLISLPLQKVLSSLSKVLFPAFSEMQVEQARLRDIYMRAMRVTAAIVIPAAVFTSACAPDLVRVVLGPGWSAAAQVLPFLAAASAVDFLSHFAGVMSEATAELNRKLLIQVTFALAFVGLIAVRPSGAIAWFAVSWLGAEVLRHMLYVRTMRRVLNAPAGQLMAVYADGIVVGATMLAVLTPIVVATRNADLSPFWSLAISSGLALMVVGFHWRRGSLRGVSAEVHVLLPRRRPAQPVMARAEAPYV